MHDFRWWVYKQLCWVAWRVCPEPERGLIGKSYAIALTAQRAISAASNG